MSGSALGKSVYTEDNVARAHALAARLSRAGGTGNATGNATETEAVLRTASARDLVVASWDMFRAGVRIGTLEAHGQRPGTPARFRPTERKNSDPETSCQSAWRPA